MWAIKKTDVSKISVDLEQDLPEVYNKTKILIKEDAFTKFYSEREFPFLEKNVSGLGLEADLLQLKDGMNCLYHLPARAFPVSNPLQ